MTDVLTAVRVDEPGGIVLRPLEWLGDPSLRLCRTATLLEKDLQVTVPGGLELACERPARAHRPLTSRRRTGGAGPSD